ncbi:CHASE2 domain-containing sensor protein/signal transduction histidine kinase [Variovorax boronicumulans]|uniref:CHASE2 domain-containing protein n=1 Tax=Variovorax boronicumulans TaxID=436515 RepID=UPI00278350F8|nr:CHASE2 domain-containing protein [Variovorax boronicumulans]MDQ0086080.1 CHASE2 domain-containing sensor protein/signal transduction histidine kinase [Variovorax boronicumulans]
MDRALFSSSDPIEPRGSKPPVLRRRIVWIGGALLALAAALGFLNGLGRADMLFFDTISTLNQRAPSEDIVIIAIDERSLAKLGRWPWRRKVHAELLQKLAKYQPAVVGLDIVLSEPSSEFPTDDLLLGEVLRSGPPSVLPVVMERHTQQRTPEAVFPTTQIAQGVLRFGHIHVELDQDGVARSVFLREGINGRWWSQLTLAMLETVPAGDSIADRLPGVRRPGPADSAAPDGSHESLWQRDYWMRIAFAGPPGHFKRVSYVDVIDGLVDLDVLKGKFVLVGVTAGGLGDSYPTPVSGHGTLMPGVEIHANVLDSLLRGFDVRAAHPWQSALFSVVPVLLALMGFLRLKTRFALPIVPLLGICVLAAAYAAQRFFSIQFAPVAPILVLIISYPLWSWQRLAAAVDYLAEEVRRTKATEGIQMHPVALARGDDLERNMTAMKESLDRLRELRRFVHDSLNGLPDATLVGDEDSVIVLANRAAQHWCQSTEPLSLIGLPINDALARICDTRNGRPELEFLMGQARSEPVVVDIEARGKNGRDLLIKFVSLRREGNPRTGWIVSLIDISGIRNAERQRDEALRFITHDMRSPQASIVATIDLHRRDGLGAMTPRILDRIERYALRTLSLADEFTHLAQVENRDLSAKAFSEVDMADVMVQSVDQYWELARARGVSIRTEMKLHGEPQAFVTGDESMLIRAVGNLISNAVKFSPPAAEVVCTLTRCGELLSVIVLDRGQGIATEDQGLLFNKFQRLRSPEGEQPDGVGLGLAYVKAVAMRHNGSVAVESTPGQGATFKLMLPARKQAEHDED